MDRHLTDSDIESFLLEEARHAAEQHVSDDMHANYTRWHRRISLCHFIFTLCWLVALFFGATSVLMPHNGHAMATNANRTEMISNIDHIIVDLCTNVG